MCVCMFVCMYMCVHVCVYVCMYIYVCMCVVERSIQHKEIAVLVAGLCHQLDSLSNFHFTPKPPREEIRVHTRAPAISMEEIIPMGVSDAAATAPQEVFKSTEEGKPVCIFVHMCRVVCLV